MDIMVGCNIILSGFMLFFLMFHLLQIGCLVQYKPHLIVQETTSKPTFNWIQHKYNLNYILTSSFISITHGLEPNRVQVLKSDPNQIPYNL